jgi:hypothetical protein
MKNDKYATPTALVVLTDKYGNEHWFAGVEVTWKKVA